MSEDGMGGTNNFLRTDQHSVTEFLCLVRVSGVVLVPQKQKNQRHAEHILPAAGLFTARYRAYSRDELDTLDDGGDALSQTNTHSRQTQRAVLTLHHI